MDINRAVFAKRGGPGAVSGLMSIALLSITSPTNPLGMLRICVLGIHFFAFFIWGLFQSERVSIDDDTPSRMSPGEEVVVTATIDKSDVSGFAKYQISMGEGLRVEAIETAGASFTFSDGKAKFIWMSLPGDAQFDIRYRLIANENASGVVDVNSRFSYIFENRRYNYDAPSKQIGIGDAVVDTAPSQPADTSDTSLPDTEERESISVAAGRTLHAEEVNQWRVEVRLDKSALEGFAKVEETIPVGYTAIDLKSSSAVFTSDGRTVKYVWYDIPQREEVTVVYKLLPVIAMDGDHPEITGSFSYLDKEETVTIPIEDEGFVEMAEPDPIAKDTTGAEVSDIAAVDEATDETEESPEEQVPPMEEPVAEPIVEDTAEEAAPADEDSQDDATAATEREETSTEKAYTDANIVDVPPPQEGIFYRVQIAAGKNNLKPPVFAKLYRFEEGYNLEHIGSWFKYTTGHHQVYKQARNDRERITAKYEKFQGPFVTAYNDGERITVQEALMITEQKWVP